MCGIAGFVGTGSESDLRKMIATLSHRGPDNQNVSLKDNVGLGHARLSIIDLNPSANQPFFSADGNVAIVFNGEIYNFLELKSELQSKNRYTFRTDSDTEVLLALYQLYDTAFFDQINGMFAFAIYDFPKKRLLLARDRMGEKPLYFGQFGDTFLFASEIKALLQHPKVTRDIDLSALQLYLTFDYVPAPYSIFKNIQKLEPGNFLTVHNNNIKQKKYWDITFSELQISFADACKQFAFKFESAVRTKLLSDVPLGFFLSGGLDSSSVAYFAQKNSTQKIKTYSVGFEDKSYDESNYAKQVADFIGSDHYSEVLTENEALSLIPTIGQKMDEPFADASIIPTYLLTKFTRKHVTVALGGDGSDELLAGYPTFLADKFIQPARTLSSLLNPALELSLKILPVSDRDIGLDFKIQQFKKGIDVHPDYTHTSWLSSFTPTMSENLWVPAYYKKFSNSKPDIVAHHLSGIKPNLSQFNRNTLLYYKTYLPDDILVKVDRASMLSSLEVRSPFLDYSLVEFINSLPKKYKQRGFKSKRILKDTMQGKLPENIIHRSKKGFGIPLSFWLRKDLRKLCDDLLSESSLGHHGYFNYSFIKKLKDDHYQRRSNNRKLLWNLMMFQLWYLNFNK